MNQPIRLERYCMYCHTTTMTMQDERCMSCWVPTAATRRDAILDEPDFMNVPAWSFTALRGRFHWASDVWIQASDKLIVIGIVRKHVPWDRDSTDSIHMEVSGHPRHSDLSTAMGIYPFTKDDMKQKLQDIEDWYLRNISQRINDIRCRVQQMQELAEEASDD